MAWTEAEAQEAHHQAQAAAKKATTAAPFRPKFFTRPRVRDRHAAGRSHHPERRALRQRDRRRRAAVHGFHDGRSAGAADGDARRAGLARSRVRHAGSRRISWRARPPQRTQVLDDIAWPQKARPELAHGVAFFNSFRDLTASGFFTSKMGIEDLQYMGNRYVPEWTGCPPEVMKKLGVGSTRSEASPTPTPFQESSNSANRQRARRSPVLRTSLGVGVGVGIDPLRVFHHLDSNPAIS